MNILSEKGTSGLRKHKVLRMASEALDQDGLLTQEDLALLLCSSRRTIRRDIKELKQQGIDVSTRGTLQDIGPGVTHKSKVVKMWLEGIPDFGQEEFRRSRNIMNTQTSSERRAIPVFLFKGISRASLNQSDSTVVGILGARTAPALDSEGVL